MTHIVRNFPSWAAFVASASDTALRTWDSDRCASQTVGDEKWYGTKDFAAAVELARVGWPYGRSKLKQAVVATKPATGRISRIAYDVAGERMHVGRAMAGDPMCMMRKKPSLKSRKKIIRVDMGFMCSASVTADELLNRGAALLSMTDTLENNGYGVELRLVAKVKSGSDMSLTMRAPYKDAGEAFDLTRAAFAMLHPSVLRRFGFAIYEQHKELQGPMSGSYGVVTHEGLSEDGIIYIPAPLHLSVLYKTPESAYAAVAAHFAEYLETK
jgi:hypothetical protein